MELLCYQTATSLTLKNYFPVKYVAVYMGIRTMCSLQDFRFIGSLLETHSANAYFWVITEKFNYLQKKDLWKEVK